MELHGIHHLTAVSSQIQNNVRFYTQVMGMRLVKRSVNQDDVSAYHLFYSGDRRGAAGNDLTFFDWDINREVRGAHSVTQTALRVNGEASLVWWIDWLRHNGVSPGDIQHLDGRTTVLFDDPEGQRLALIDDGGQGDAHQPWDKSQVPADHQIRGLGPIQLTVPDLRPTDAILTQVMNMRQVRQYLLMDHPKLNVFVYEMGGRGPHAELHVAVDPLARPAQLGAGAVHHVAFRTMDADYQAWHERLKSYQIPNSGEVDRFWFRSLYFREPNGILFEIATDEPGFSIDESEETLGESIVLPPFLEPRRAEIVANLKPIEVY